jgi:hypothetical protein
MAIDLVNLQLLVYGQHPVLRTKCLVPDITCLCGVCILNVCLVFSDVQGRRYIDAKKTKKKPKNHVCT